MSDLVVTSGLFSEGAAIPARAAHPMVGGENVSPDLHFAGVPGPAASLAVTCYDPDAPTTVGFVHWVLFNLDPTTTALPAGAGGAGRNPSGSTHGFTDWGQSAYGGMAPPSGDPPHHYHFTAWALDTRLDDDETMTYARFRFMVRGHVLAQATLTGLYSVGASGGHGSNL